VPSGVTGLDNLTASTVTEANNVVESTTGNFGAAPVRTTNYYYDDAAHPGDLNRIVDAGGHTTTVSAAVRERSATVFVRIIMRVLSAYVASTVERLAQFLQFVRRSGEQPVREL